MSDHTFRVDSLDAEESPCTVSYALLTLMCAATYMSLTLEEEIDGDYIIVTNEMDGEVVFRLKVTYVMGQLLLSTLERVDSALRGEDDDDYEEDEPWDLRN